MPILGNSVSAGEGRDDSTNYRTVRVAVSSHFDGAEQRFSIAAKVLTCVPDTERNSVLSGDLGSIPDFSGHTLGIYIERTSSNREADPYFAFGVKSKTASQIALAASFNDFPFWLLATAAATATAIAPAMPSG